MASGNSNQAFCRKWGLMPPRPTDLFPALLQAGQLLKPFLTLPERAGLLGQPRGPLDRLLLQPAGAVVVHPHPVHLPTPPASGQRSRQVRGRVRRRAGTQLPERLGGWSTSQQRHRSGHSSGPGNQTDGRSTAEGCVIGVGGRRRESASPSRQTTGK